MHLQLIFRSLLVIMLTTFLSGCGTFAYRGEGVFVVPGADSQVKYRIELEPFDLQHDTTHLYHLGAIPSENYYVVLYARESTGDARFENAQLSIEVVDTDNNQLLTFTGELKDMLSLTYGSKNKIVPAARARPSTNVEYFLRIRVQHSTCVGKSMWQPTIEANKRIYAL